MRQPDWLDQTDVEDGAGRSRTRPALLVAAGLPWVLVVALLVLPGRLSATAGDAADEPAVTDPAAAQGMTTEDGQETVPSTEISGDVPSPVPDLDPVPGGAQTPDGAHLGTPLVEVRGRWRAEPGLEEAASLAVVVARAWLTGLEPVLEIDRLGAERDGHGYAEHLVVEAVEHPAPGAAVVTIVAIVLDGPDLDAVVRRVAVPIVTGAQGPRSAGAPWELPPPVLDPVTLDREPIEDPELLLAGAEALHAAGLTGHTLLELHRTDGWPVLATVSPPDGDAHDEVVWLREHVGGLVVAGTTLAGHDPHVLTHGASDDTSDTPPDIDRPDGDHGGPADSDHGSPADGDHGVQEAAS